MRKRSGSRSGNQRRRRSSATIPSPDPATSARNAGRSVYSRRCDGSSTLSPSRFRKYQAHSFLNTVVRYARPPGRSCRRISARYARSSGTCSMTIVETAASSEPSAIAGTESADATTVSIQGKRASTRASRAASRSTAYTGRSAEMWPLRASAGKRGPSPQPRSASASGPAGRCRSSRRGSAGASKWSAVSVYRSAIEAQATRRRACSRRSRPRSSPT